MKRHLLIKLGLQYMPGGCIIAYKLMPGLQYMPGSCGKGVENAPSGHTCVMGAL